MAVDAEKGGEDEEEEEDDDEEEGEEVELEEIVANFAADMSRLGKEASRILGNCFLLARLSCEEAVEESM